MNKNILVIETAVDGHRGFYLNWVVKSFLEDGHKVVVAMPEKYKSDPSLDGLNSENLHFELYQLDEPNKNKWPKLLGFIVQDLLKYIQFKNLYKKCSRQAHIDFVFIPFIDHIFYSSSIFGSPFGECKFSGISMRPDFHYHKFGLNVPVKKYSFLKEMIFKRFFKISTLNSLLTLDESLYLYFSDAYGERLRFLPEPADVLEIRKSSKEKIAAKLGLDLRMRSILVFGSINKRKGIIQLVESFARLADKHSLQLIIAGIAKKEMRAYFSTDKLKQLISGGKLLLIDRFISEEEESVLFSHAYVCWLGYLDHHRASGVLITSAKYAVPVIATNQGVIGWQVDRFGLGLVVDVDNEKEIALALDEMCTNTEFHSKCRKNASNAFLDNTLDNAKKIVCDSMSITQDVDE